MTEEQSDDRDDQRKVYGLPDQNKMKFNQSMIWVPIAIGLSVAAGIITTRGMQRLTRGASIKPSTTPTTSSSASSSTATAKATSSKHFELGTESQTSFSAKTFTGFVPYSGDLKNQWIYRKLH
eukprot:47187_1